MKPIYLCRGLFLLGLPALAACATNGPACRSGEQAAVQDLLYFGTKMPQSQVSPEDWAGFLAKEVTPRFPDGLTVWRASGQWREADGEISSEASYVLSLVHPETEASEGAIRAIAAAYKTGFRQEAVLRAKSPACLSFP